ncbi:MAG: 2-phosphosulfolactate phosphatase [bacterium]|jgi:2-phosphosulfolactate phosphatase
MSRSVVIDCFPESAEKYKRDHAIVVVDVIRATTTAATAISLGRKVFPVRSTDEAFVCAAKMKKPLLVGELGGNMPYGFDLTNSPVQISIRADIDRPMILVSSSGTQLLLNSSGSEGVYISCFRNFSAVVKYVTGRHDRVALLGAGSRGSFRREDQMGCAWVAEKLVHEGYDPENRETSDRILKWSGISSSEARNGKSAEYLRKTGQEHDLDFIVKHVDDLDTVPALVDGELVLAAGTVLKPLSLTEN